MDLERPTVTIKIAQTLDGKVTTSGGESKWITGPEARAAGHRLRSENDAILVGVGTILADDPELTVRHVSGPNPLRIVLDGDLRTPASARLLGSDGFGTIILTGKNAPREREEALVRSGARVVRLSRTFDRISLPETMQFLSSLDVTRLLVEGGPTVVTTFLRAGLVDSLAVFVAPMLFGTGYDAIGDLNVYRIGDAVRGEIVSTERLGHDLLIRLNVRPFEPTERATRV